LTQELGYKAQIEEYMKSVKGQGGRSKVSDGLSQTQKRVKKEYGKHH
jgi:hypothetical protein